jgi:hypothetical protein
MDYQGLFLVGPEGRGLAARAINAGNGPLPRPPCPLPLLEVDVPTRARIPHSSARRVEGGGWERERGGERGGGILYLLGSARYSLLLIQFRSLSFRFRRCYIFIVLLVVRPAGARQFTINIYIHSSACYDGTWHMGFALRRALGRPRAYSSIPPGTYTYTGW